jgi:predicted dehydrogenase
MKHRNRSMRLLRIMISDNDRLLAGQERRSASFRIEKEGRRSFLKTSIAAGVGLGLQAGNALSQPADEQRESNGKEVTSLGFIGVGHRGLHLLALALKHEGVVVKAVCDINPAAIQASRKILGQHGQTQTEYYEYDEFAYKKLLERDDIDGVIIATPWDWHVPMSLDALKADKYVGLEVPATMTLEECWQLVDACEKSGGGKLMFLENCCYDRECMAVLRMLRDGLFGTPLHATCGYRHSAWGSSNWLKPVELNDKSAHFMKYAASRNADQYPTHGIGPVAHWFGINCGNRFASLNSVSTRSASINEYVGRHPNGGAKHPNATRKFEQGDVVTTVVKTIKGETIVITYDNYLPRPYSRDYSLQGTGGIWSGSYQARGIYIEGKSPSPHQWEKEAAYDAYFSKFDHPMWRQEGSKAASAGHGGIDYFTIKQYVECVRTNAQPPIDVYDAVTWSAIIPLSEESIRNGGAAQEFPDFTRGKWETRKSIFGL